MRTGKLSRGEIVAATSGVVLLIAMGVLDWFASSGTSVDLPPEFLGIPDVGFNAWQSFSVIDLVLLLVGATAIGGSLIAATSRSVNSPVAVQAVTCASGLLAAVLLLFRLADPPGDLHREIGIYVGLAACLGIAYGGWRAMAAENTSFLDQARRL